MERCPVCRARLKDDPVCGRCGTNLDKPRAAAAQADKLLRRALETWRSGETTAAMRLLHRSQQLHRHPLKSALLDCLLELNLRRAVYSLQQGDSVEALHLSRRVLAVRPRHPMAYALQSFIHSYGVSGKYFP